MAGIINLLTWRYLTQSAYERTISPMIIISFFSISVGTFCLILVNAIMNGFEKTTYQKLQSIHPQLVIKAKNQVLNVPKIIETLKEKFPCVTHVSPSYMEHAIIRHKDSSSNFNVIALKGIYPELEKKVIPLESNIVGPEKNLTILLEGNQLVIGNGLAQELNLKIGDAVELIMPGQDEYKENEQFDIEKSSAIIGEIIKTGIEEFDQLVAYSSINFFKELFPTEEIQQISLKLDPTSSEALVLEQLKKEFELPVYSWKDLYPALVSALKLEKYAMFLILTLICIVASMNIFALLFMLITQKKSDLAVLRAMGASASTINSIVVRIGLFLTIGGALFGTGAALITSWIINHFKLITLPDIYYVSYLPAIIEPWNMVGTFILILIISLVASWYPAYKTRSINIAQLLRFEG